MKWMRLKIVTGVKSFSKPEQPQPKKSKFLSASKIPISQRRIDPDKKYATDPLMNSGTKLPFISDVTHKYQIMDRT